MPESRTLRLSEMLFQQRGSFRRRLVHAAISLALRFFFRRIETSGAEAVPASGPLIFVLNHPNGLIDPGLVFCALPRRVSFLAKSTLFKMPGVAWLLRTVEALPVYRRVDAGAEVGRNRLTFAACHALLRQGRCIALFPEGVSHSAPRLLPVKTGAARIALGALAVKDEGGDGGAVLDKLQIVPAGLYYTHKTPFRGEALIRFGEPFEVLPVEPDSDGEPPREAVRALSEHIAEALRAVTLNVEDEELEVVAKAGQLFSSIYQGLNFRQTLAEELEFRRRFAGERRGAASAASGAQDQAGGLAARIREFEEELRGVGLTPERLSVSSHPRWQVVRYLFGRGLLLSALLPFALVGVVTHAPAYLVSDLISRRFRRHGPDESSATAKILAGMLFVPLTWLAVAAWIFGRWGWQFALAALPVAALCGYAALRWAEEVYDLRGWFKAALLLARRRDFFLRLLRRRWELHREIRRE
jgi:glycerol-3-phosphate O-acyltransferase / dihydroxyacetone phosphate acyltransferase